MRIEPIQPGNPHKLTLKQHVFPMASIRRFANARGKLHIWSVGDTKPHWTGPKDPILYGRRLWDERAEKGYMKDIEDEYQAVADKIVGGASSLTAAQVLVVTRFFALWTLRAQTPQNGVPEQVINLVAGETLTLDERERLEQLGCLYIRDDQTMPGRVLAGMQIQMQIDVICHQFQGRRWGIIRAVDGEFTCPDTFDRLAAIPVNPSICLYRGHSDTMISKQQVQAANQFARSVAKRYYMARDFAACPL
jgi:hypothetical protein